MPWSSVSTRKRALRPRAAALSIALAIAALAVGPRQARARPSPFGRTNVEVEGPLSMLLFAGAALLPRLLTARPPANVPACGRCDPRSIQLGFDRWTVQARSRAAAIVSDVLVYSLIASVGVVPFVERGVGGGSNRDAMRDYVVGLQTLGVTLALTQLTKYLVRRARPYAYNRSVSMRRRSGSEARLSFFSGHASMTFASATVIGYTYWRRHPDHPARALVLAGALGTAATTAVLRVVAGKHFLSDVVVGALVGAAIGLLIPFVHDDGGSAPAARAQLRRNGARAPMITPLSFAGRF